jgi:ADP-ribose pyrophosphatase YjhB (NUDIX family)
VTAGPQPARRRRVAAYGLLRDPGGRALLVPGPDGTWTLPGATVEHGENPHTTVARLMPAQTGFLAGVRTVRAACADRVLRPGGPAGDLLVHHDRIVFALDATPGEPAPPARWLRPAELGGARLTAYTRDVIGVDGESAAAADPDEGWPVERGLAMDVSGPRPRVQRFSTYALATDPAGRVLLARIAPGYPGAGRWHLPGGGTDFGESPDAALLREVTEETGQRGRVVGLLSVSHRHNPEAMGWEGYPIDWHTIRVVYRMAVDAPERPVVTEAAGGSTAEAAWVAPATIDRTGLTELAATVLSGAGLPGLGIGRRR